MRRHGFIWSTALILSLTIGWLDYETTSWKILLCNKGNLAALLIYTFIIAGLGYVLSWIFTKCREKTKNS